MRKFNSGVCLLGLVFLVSLFFPLSVWAQSPAGLSISPPTFEISANPGDTLTNTIRVTNLNESSVLVSVDRRNFTAVGEEGSIGLTEEETSFSLASWISVEPESVRIPGRDSHTFIFTIAIPANAEPGGHFGSVVFKTGGAQPGQTGAALSQEVGALVLLRVAGQAEESASLASFSSTKNLWEYGPVDLELRVKNEGNVHVRPTGTIIVTNIWGRQVAEIELEPRNVLPGAIRRSLTTWEEKNLIGKYTATVYLTYGNQGKTLTASTAFWAFPYRVGGLVLAGLLVLMILLYRGRKRVKKALRILLAGK